MPDTLSHVLSIAGQALSFAPLINLLVYLLLFHGTREPVSDHWL